MRELRGKVAAVTGAASGIGRALVDAFVSEGMRVGLADVEPDALHAAEQELCDGGAEVVAVVTDVSQREAVDAFADAVIERLGGVHVVCNNAGVASGGGRLWATTEQDWSWVLGVNLMGVVHGIQAFVPLMLERGEEGHIVNTASVLGLSTGPGSVYGVSKHAVTRLTEGLYFDLKDEGAPIGVSVLCPGLIATRIVSSDRNRPSNLRNPGEVPQEQAERRQAMQAMFLELGMPPAEVAAAVVEAIKTDRFYVLTHPGVKKQVETRLRDILEDGDPTPPESLLDLANPPKDE